MVTFLNGDKKMGKIANRDYDLKGRKFGRLTVIKKAGCKQYTSVVKKTGKTRIKKNVIWLCKCECGKKTKVITNHLFGGNAQSCGCLAKEMKKQKLGRLHHNWSGHEGISGAFWNRQVRNAVLRKHDFNISKEYAWDILEKQKFKCALSGVDIAINSSRAAMNTSGTITASIDRIDSSKGYIEGNIQWLHTKVNYMKQEMSQEEFVQFCRLITKYNGDAA